MNSPASGRYSSPKPEAPVQVGAPLAQAPQAGRVEAADHHLALGHQHALDLAQRGVRVGVQLQRVRQHHQVEAVLLERQRREVGDQRRPALGRRAPAARAAPASCAACGWPAARRARAGPAAARGSRRCRPPRGRTRPAPRPADSGRAGSRTTRCIPIIWSLMKLIPLPAFQDNYIWLLHDGQRALVVDPGDAAPVLDCLRADRPAAGGDSSHAPPRRPHRRRRRAARGHRRAGVRARRASASPSRCTRLAEGDAHRGARACASRCSTCPATPPATSPTTAPTCDGAPAALLRRHAVLRRLRPPVRRHAGADARTRSTSWPPCPATPACAAPTNTHSPT